MFAKTDLFLDLFSSRGCHVLLFNVMGCCCQAQEDLDKVKQLDIDDMWLQVGVFDGKTNNQRTRCSMYGLFTYMIYLHENPQNYPFVGK